MKCTSFVFLLLFLTGMSQTGFSQYLKTDTVKWVTLRDTVKFDIALNSKDAEESLKTHLGIPKNYEFRDKIVKGVWPTKDQTKEKDELGYVHQRYTQYYKGIKVEHSDVRTHYFDDKLVAVNGTYIDAPDIDVSVILSKEAAIQKAMEHIGANKYIWEDEKECEALKAYKIH